MLPPHLRQGFVLAQRQSLGTLVLKATSTTVLRTSLAHAQSRRSFFGWRRRADDWSSHLDPSYHRFCRFRTLQTRAKLLKNLRRRGKFNWDFDSKPFFTPQLVRWASHWDGKPKRTIPWILNEDAKKAKEESEVDGKKAEEDGFELSPREKEWKEKMEAMRKRIEKDPYEAIFGKRFEPFWSPLVPSWMREEMGLQGWPKPKEKDTSTSKPTAPEPEPTKTVKNETADKAKMTQPEVSKMETASADPSIKPEQKWTEQKWATPNSSSYSYASSTSWDSWTNKTRRVEWDSASGQTRKYEYDPISNRMVQVEAPKPASPTETKSIEAAQDIKKPAESLKEALTPRNAPLKIKLEASARSLEGASKSTTESKGVNIPVKQSSDLRKSIPIPPPLSQPSLGWSKIAVAANTSIGPVKSTAVLSEVSKPASLTKLPEKKDVDLLTADEVRASMGKTKVPAVADTKAASAPEEKTQIAAILNERDGAKTKAPSAKNSEWDQAEMSVMLDKELESLQKKKDKLVKDERGLFHIERQRRELQKLDDRIKEVTARVEKLSLAATNPKKEVKEASKNVESESTTLRSSLDRMQSKELPKAVELDDSAAHESTEGIAAFNAVPKNWTQQADLLQADRVRRTASKRPIPVPTTRWADDMQARKNAYEVKKAEEKAANADRQAKLEKANAMLEAEVKEQKFRMQAHENRYAHKIRSLRQELETAYKQSTVHSEKHLERIRALEEELAKVTKAANGAGTAMKVEKEVKEPSKKEVEQAQQKAKDRELVKEVREIYEKAYGTIDVAHRQPTPPVEVDQQKPAVPAPGKKLKQVVEVETDVDLGEALARYEKEAPPYTFPKDQNLENEIAREEREYYEGGGPLFKAKLPVLAETNKAEPSDAGKKLVDDKMPKLIPTELTKPAPTEEEAFDVTNNESDAKSSTLADGICWEEPPVYKVLAYDSGNDMMSAATTTSNFTGSEAPISITQALSHLYQPARFVPYFAELQKDGYQVIFGTTDLLVFKKVKAPNVSTARHIEQDLKGLQDHGLGLPFESRGQLERVIATELENTNSAINPIDGTSKPPPPAPSTGNFASPTGFVNHDPILPSDPAAEFSTKLSKDFDMEGTSKQSQVEGQEEEDDIEWRHYPRVRRMEQHFTGSRRRWNSNHRRHKRVEERERDFTRKRKSTFRWIVGAGIGTAGVMYLVGAAAEKARHRQEEDWARKAEEQRKSWMWRSS